LLPLLGKGGNARGGMKTNQNAIPSAHRGQIGLGKTIPGVHSQHGKKREKKNSGMRE